MAEKFNEVDNERLRDPLDYMKNEVKNSFVFSPTSTFEIHTLIDKLNNKKSSGYDLISNSILRETKDIIAPYLNVLFNKCISQGIFPDSFKTAQVIPLFKGGDKEDPNPYRPIPLLLSIGELFDKLISKRIINFFNKYEIFSSHQFGFRSNFATEYPVIDIHEKLVKNLDEGLSSCAIFLDLAKAFDSVDHSILIRKLKHYGIRGLPLQLLRSYLSDRNQFVKLNDANSSLIDILFGVPQGSILGPLLFLIFINDLPEATNLYVKLFADDMFLCAQDTNLESLENYVNIELDKVFVWLASNKLTLNVKKSKYMIVSRKKSIPDLCIQINGCHLDQCDSYKYLGIYID